MWYSGVRKSIPCYSGVRKSIHCYSGVRKSIHCYSGVRNSIHFLLIAFRESHSNSIEQRDLVCDVFTGLSTEDGYIWSNGGIIYKINCLSKVSYNAKYSSRSWEMFVYHINNNTRKDVSFTTPKCLLLKPVIILVST